jgi:superfamily II DNA/RNA helicase
VQNALIFCNRKRDVDILYKSLKRHGFSAGSLHGDMSQPERFATLGKFRAGELRLLVCSDVAARGIDIGGLSHVFNFDVPIHAEDYVHRIGRTGRAGLTGHAYTLATPDDRVFVEAIEKLVGAAIPRIQVEGFEPLDWAEDGGKKRRGRSRSAKPVKPKAKAETFEDATAIAIPVPKKRRGKAAAAVPVPVDAPQPDVAEPRPRREERGRVRRDDDLGPPVVGFGDEVPAFMLLRAGGPKLHTGLEAE